MSENDSEAMQAARKYLTLRGDGRWQKKSKGNVYYFRGKPEKVLATFLKVRELIEEGADPKRVQDMIDDELSGGYTIAQCFEDFLADKLEDANKGAIQPKRYKEIEMALEIFTEVINESRRVESLTPEDFKKVRERIAKKYGVDRQTNCIRNIKQAFTHTKQEVDYGRQFNVPSESEKNVEKDKTERETGGKGFTAEELAVIIPRLPDILEAPVLLGLNCGFLEVDLGRFEIDNIDWADGATDFMRWKKHTKRRGIFWPETLAALKGAIARRPQPAKPEYAKLVFLTRNGLPVCREHVTKDGDVIENSTRVASIYQAFDRFLDKLERDGLLKRRKGVGFASLRTTFSTEADNTLDLEARRLMMGQKFDGIDRFYVKHICFPRLIQVAAHTRAAFKIAEHYGHVPQPCPCVGCHTRKNIQPLLAIPAMRATA